MTKKYMTLLLREALSSLPQLEPTVLSECSICGNCGYHNYTCLSNRAFFNSNLEHSTIIYESPDMSSLLRLCWNRQDDYYLATISMDSSKAIILDIR